jgi:membrane AbrB-like protein
VRVAVAWLGLLAATVAASLLASLAGVPGPTLFASLLVGIAWALAKFGPDLDVPEPAFALGQAVIGVELGAYLSEDTLTAVAHDWLPVLITSVLTLVVTVIAGLVLARVTSLDASTASLGSIAGGASGIVAMADELGADDRLVAVMQYLRVLVIVLLTPLLASIAFGVNADGSGGESLPFFDWTGLALVVLAGGAGMLLGHLLRLPVPSLMGPMLLTGALALTGVLGDTTVPNALRQVAFIAIGLQVGLRFTPASLRAARSILAPVLVSIFALLAVCAGLGWLLSVMSDATFFEGYLATTPGGLFAVLGVALASGVNTTFVLAVQSLRLFVMVLAAPAVARWLARRRLR